MPAGYNYDCVNADVLLNRMAVKDHYLVLPDGMTYQLLVLPTQRTMSPEVLRKVKALIEDGATVLGNKPLRAPGLANWPKCDKELKGLADLMWRGNATRKGRHDIGKGHLVWGFAVGDFVSGLAPPDFESPADVGQFDFIHRVIDAADFYFVANRSGRVAKGEFWFRNHDSIPELWDPVTGIRRDLTSYVQDFGSSMGIPLEFEPHQSFFVVFRKPIPNLIGGDGKPNFPRLKQVAELAGSWTVAFDPKWGGPEKVVFDKLVDWTTRPEEGIKYYSGTAVYRKTFDLADLPLLPKKRVFLDLGTVNYLARVRLNGKDLGVAWTAPWRVDISGVVKEKGNELQIEVVNTWLNRLVGDAHLPAEKRLAKTNVGYPPTYPLMPSGLLGPVTVRREL